MIGVTMHLAPPLLGRADELEILRRLIADVRNGRSGVVVVRGEPGIGRRVTTGPMFQRAGYNRTYVP